MLLTTNQLMQKYGISRQTVYVWRKEGMPCLQLSSHNVVFEEVAVEAWVAENKRRY